MAKLSAALFTALFFFVSAVGHSQTSAPVWFTLNVQEGQTVTATGSITLRFGQAASTCAYTESTGPCSAGAGAPSPAAWTSPQTFTGSTVSVVVGAAAFGNVDPLPGVYKTVQVEEQSNPQNITVNGQPVTVPALSGASAPSSAPVWFTLNAQEGQTITASGSIALRFGQVASTCAYTESTGPCTSGPGAPSPEAWTTPQTFTGSTVSIVVGATAFGNVDPLPGVSKTVQVEEQSTPQNITVNGQPVTVPALSSSSAPSSAPVWFTLNAQEGQTITASGSITLRFGQVESTCAYTESTGPCTAGAGAPSPEAWTPPQTFNGSTVSVVIGAAAFGNADPLPGVYKTVQVEEQSTPQSITVNGQQVSVPALSGSSTCQLLGTPGSIAFPNTTVGYMISSSGSISSNCTTTVTINSVQSSGAPFSTSGFQTPFSLAPGQSQTYTAVFAPTTVGTVTGSIAFASNVSSVQALSVSLTGTGVASQSATLTSNPTSVSFGNVSVNTSRSQTVTITNPGATSITVSAVHLTGTGFSLGSLTTPFTLGSNQSAQLTVNFVPTANGSASGSLTITSTAQNGTLSVALTGTGVTHSVSLFWGETGSQIAGYNVYRSTVSNGPYTQIDGALVGSTSYTDGTVASGTTYFYVVTAVGTNGVESPYSNQTQVTVP